MKTLLTILMLTFLATPQAWACKCLMELSTPEGQINYADTIFIGEVKETIPKGLTGMAEEATFNVEKTFKGTSAGEMSVVLSQCPRIFSPAQQGQKFLVLAKTHEENGKSILRAGFCSGTDILKNTTQLMNLLENQK